MTITPFHRNDIGRFLDLALAEEWITGEWELEFLLSAFPGGCFCMRDKNGNATGFVTSLKHDRSGWIGNLIVSPDLRGGGRGEALFGSALEALRRAGSETVWLTASEMGRPLYEKHGFCSVDRIVRWVGQARGGSPDSERVSPAPFDAALDMLCWGDRRDRLLERVTGHGLTIAEPGACATVQQVAQAVQLGPWAASDRESAGRVLSSALSHMPAGTKIICDTPLSNGMCQELLQRSGFFRQGETGLMYAGAEPAYQSACLYALATLGSSG
jgi:ribosomal protein S18 acetylase RimI-like enzyme